MNFTLDDFMRESLRIEGIRRAPTPTELRAREILLYQERLRIEDLCEFVERCEPDARLRDKPGLDVRVGKHMPPPGGRAIRWDLEAILDGSFRKYWTPFKGHRLYETLHPFTDCNGRSGRALWLWMMGGIDKALLGFLHHFYYQTLEETR